MRRCSWWVPAVRGANRFVFFFARTHFLACEDVAGGSQQSGGNVFFVKYGGPSGEALLSGGGIIILHVIRRHFLACEDIAGGSELSGEELFFFCS